MTYFYYDGDNLLAETDASDNLMAVYEWGVRGLVSQLRNGVRYYYHFDGLGSVVQMTDSSQNVVASYKYDAWGNDLTDPQSPIPNPFRYEGGLGYYSDKDSRLKLLGVRYYDSQIGRFWTMDPIKFAGGELNLYIYCLNAPINHTDPFGLQTSKNTPHGYIEIMRMAIEEAIQNRVPLRQTSWWNYGKQHKHHIFPQQFRPEFMKIFGKISLISGH